MYVNSLPERGKFQLATRYTVRSTCGFKTTTDNTEDDYLVAYQNIHSKDSKSNENFAPLHSAWTPATKTIQGEIATTINDAGFGTFSSRSVFTSNSRPQISIQMIYWITAIETDFLTDFKLGSR